MSPAHQKRVCGRMPHPDRLHAVPPYVDPDVFRAPTPVEMRQQRQRPKNHRIYVGACSDAMGLSKGIAGMLRHCEFKGLECEFHGQAKAVDVATFGAHPMAWHSGQSAEPARIAAKLRRHHTFLWHLPRWGSYGRTLVEAALSGLRFDLGGKPQRFGLFSYDWITPDNPDRARIVAALDQGRRDFWEIVTRTL